MPYIIRHENNADVVEPMCALLKTQNIRTGTEQRVRRGNTHVLAGTELRSGC
jgi:hypothetical protein